MQVIKVILDEFVEASGLSINLEKCAIIPVNLDNPSAVSLASLFRCPLATFPLIYLGLPLSPLSLRRADFLPLIEKLDKRLAGWKGLLLSRAGRLVLLNTVLSSIPTFFCSAFLLPGWAIKAMDRIRRGFFWKGRVLDNGFHCLINWDRVCRPKASGGLGIRNLKAMNSSLLIKISWSFLHDSSKPWCRLIRSLYYKRRHPCAPGSAPSNCSPLWRGALSTAAPFLTSIAFQLGDGKAVSFWHFRWSGDTPLRSRFPTLFAASPLKHLSVNCWFRRLGSLPNFGFAATILGSAIEVPALSALVSATHLSHDPDSVLWR